MTTEQIKNVLLEVAGDAMKRGPGWAQESVVLREAADRISGKNTKPDLKTEQAILNAWHDLFMDRKLAWGYDLDNPNSPFFHVR